MTLTENTAIKVDTATTEEEIDINRMNLGEIYVNGQNDAICGTIIAAILCLAGMASYSLFL